MTTIGFLHTAHAHARPFEALVAHLSPGVRVVTAVDEPLLGVARASGVDAAVAAATLAHLRRLRDEGADVIVCTCTTLAQAAESAAAAVGVPVLRVDRPAVELAAAAASAGSGRIAMVTSLPTARAATVSLFRQISDADVAPVVCDDLHALFDAGDPAGFHREVAGRVRPEARGVDAVLLAQASLAGAGALLGDFGVPVLSTPEAAVRAALASDRRF